MVLRRTCFSEMEWIFFKKDCLPNFLPHLNCFSISLTSFWEEGFHLWGDFFSNVYG